MVIFEDRHSVTISHIIYTNVRKNLENEIKTEDVI